MISFEHRLIFIHIPKSGGVSVEQALDLDRRYDLDDHFKINYQHAFLDEVQSHFRVGPEFFAFCFVRNPWDRLVSYYFHLKKNKLFTRKQSFREFAVTLLTNDLTNDAIRPKNPPALFMDNGAAWACHEDMDFVGRVETMQADFDTVCDRVGLSRRDLPHANRSRHRPYHRYYDDETRDLVARVYRRDIEQFGYEFR